MNKKVHLGRICKSKIKFRIKKKAKKSKIKFTLFMLSKIKMMRNAFMYKNYLFNIFPDKKNHLLQNTSPIYLYIYCS